MTNDINLIKQTTIQRKNIGKLVVGLYAVFGIVFLIAIGLLLYSFSLQTTIDSLTSQKEAANARINSFAEQKDNLLVISERLSAIKNVISQRRSIDKKLGEVLTIVPENMSVESVTVDEELVSMRLASPSLSDFDKLLEEDIPAFTAQEGNEVKLVEMGSFSQLSQGYSVGLDFYYAIKNKK